MEKKNSVVLTIIAIATLLVAVVSATFAYFASGASGSSTTVNVTTASAAAFTSRITGSLDVYADSTNMANVTGKKGVWTGSNTASVEVTLNGDPGTYCYYNLTFYRAVGASDDYVRYSATPSPTGGGLFLKVLWDGNSTTPPANATGSDFDYMTEKEFLGYPAFDDGFYNIGDGIIIIPDGSTTTSSTLDVTMSFKNLDTDQLANAGKRFAGTLEVEEIYCYDKNDNLLSSGAPNHGEAHPQ